MRTIGRRWIRKIEELVEAARVKGMEGASEIEEQVKDKLPEEVFNIWEGAHEEIRRLVWDFVTRPKEGSMKREKELEGILDAIEIAKNGIYELGYTFSMPRYRAVYEDLDKLWNETIIEKEKLEERIVESSAKKEGSMNKVYSGIKKDMDVIQKSGQSGHSISWFISEVEKAVFDEVKGSDFYLSLGDAAMDLSKTYSEGSKEKDVLEYIAATFRDIRNAEKRHQKILGGILTTLEKITKGGL